MEYCVRFIDLMTFKVWWRNHLVPTKCPIIYWTREAITFFIMLLCFFTLLCSILLLPISSFKFLLRQKAVTGSFWKIFLNALLIDKRFQCLRTTLLIFGRDGLYVNTSGIIVSFDVVLSLSFKNSFLFIFSTAFKCLLALVCNLDWQTSVWALHNNNSDWNHLVLCRSVWF